MRKQLRKGNSTKKQRQAQQEAQLRAKINEESKRATNTLVVRRRPSTVPRLQNDLVSRYLSVLARHSLDVSSAHGIPTRDPFPYAPVIVRYRVRVTKSASGDVSFVANPLMAFASAVTVPVDFPAPAASSQYPTIYATGSDLFYDSTTTYCFAAYMPGALVTDYNIFFSAKVRHLGGYVNVKNYAKQYDQGGLLTVFQPAAHRSLLGTSMAAGGNAVLYHVPSIGDVQNDLTDSTNLPLYREQQIAILPINPTQPVNVDTNFYNNCTLQGDAGAGSSNNGVRIAFADTVAIPDMLGTPALAGFNFAVIAQPAWAISDVDPLIEFSGEMVYHVSPQLEGISAGGHMLANTLVPSHVAPSDPVKTARVENGISKLRMLHKNHPQTVAAAGNALKQIGSGLADAAIGFIGGRMSTASAAATPLIEEAGPLLLTM